MRLQDLFKGMLLSQGYVATLRALREIAPETLPSTATTERTVVREPARHAARGGGGATREPEPLAAGESPEDAARAVDLAGSMPWQVAYARHAPRAAQAPRVATARAGEHRGTAVLGAVGGGAGACCA